MHFRRMLLYEGRLPGKRPQRPYFSITLYVLVIFELFTCSSNLLISTQFENTLQRLSTEALGVKNMQVIMNTYLQKNVYLFFIKCIISVLERIYLCMLFHRVYYHRSNYTGSGLKG